MLREKGRGGRSHKHEAHALEFHRLGLGTPVPLSALHGHGTGDLLDEIVRRLPEEGTVLIHPAGMESTVWSTIAIPPVRAIVPMAAT